MRWQAAEKLDIDPARLVLTAFVVGSVIALSFGAIVGGEVGSASPGVDGVVGVLAFYLVVSAPRRVLEAERTSQARESPFMSMASTAFRSVSGSRSRTLLEFRSRDKVIASVLKTTRRMVLLGVEPEEAVARASERLSSYSAISALKSATTLSPLNPSGGEEASGLETAFQLERETKVPLFMTVCFFTPVILVLLAVFSHRTDPQGMLGLLAGGIVVLDLSYFLCSPQKSSP